ALYADHLAASAEPHRRLRDAVENRLAVLVLADLEIGRVIGRLDEIDFRVDLGQTRRVLAHLAAENKGAGKAGFRCLQSGPVDGPDAAHSVTDETRGAIH